MMSPSTEMRKSDKWIPYYFVLFFVVVAAVNAFFVYKALHSYSGVVIDNAYEHGLAYNKTLDAAEAEKNSGISQQLTYQNGVLSWVIRDKEGKPVNNAKVHATFLRAVQDGKDFDRNLTFSGNGQYKVSVNAPLPGVWTAKCEATWNNQSFRTTYHIFVP